MKFWLFSLLAVVGVADAAPKWTEESEWAEKKTRPNIYLNEKNEVEAVVSTALKDYATNPFIIVWPVDQFYPAN